MNKKRIALALAGALSINTLMLTVGQVGGQAQIAHAQEARLTNPEQVALATVSSLKTTVKSVDDHGTVVLAFDGVTSSSQISDLRVTYLPFGGTGSGQSLSHPMVSSNGEVTINGVKDAGIYTLTLKVDGKAFAVSFRQTTENNVLTASTVTVATNSIKVDGIAVNGTKVKDGKIELYKKGSSSPESSVKLMSDTVTFPNLTIGNVGDAYDLVYFDKDGKEQARTQLLVTKEDAKVRAMATNNKDAVSTIDAQIKADYGTDSITLSTAPILEGGKVNDVTLSFRDSTNNKELVSYVQTRIGKESEGKFGGIIKDVTVVDGNTLDVSLEPQARFGLKAPGTLVQGLKLQNVASTMNQAAKEVVFGEYTIQFDNQPKDVFANESERWKVGSPSLVVGTSNNQYVNLIGGTDITSGSETKINVTKSKFTFDLGDLDHGYKTVAVTFGVDDGTISGGSTISELNLSLSPSISLVTAFADTVVNPIKTSIVVSKDTREASIINASYTGTGDKGTFTLTGIEDVFKGFDGADIVNKGQITIDGAKSILFNRSSSDNNKLVFDVTFEEGRTGGSNWRFGNLTGTIRSQSVEVLNLDRASITDTKGSADEVTLDVDFNLSDLDNIAQTTFSGNGISETPLRQIRFEDLKTGSYDIKVTTTGQHAGVYTTGVYVEKNPIAIKIDADSSSNSGVTVKIDAFLNGQKPENIKSGQIQYREVTIDDKGTSDEKDDVVTKYGNWTDSKVTFSASDFKEEEITKTVTGLDSGKVYDIRVLYRYQAPNSSTTVDVYSNVDRVKAPATSTGNDSSITGSGSSSSTSGTSTGSTTITVTDRNSTKGSGSVSVDLPSSVRFDDTKTPVAVKFTYKDKDGKIVTEISEQYANVKASFENGDIKVEGLVPGKQYDQISIDYTDKNGRTRTVVLKDVRVDSTSDLQRYLADVYTAVLNRPADETGYHFHLGNLYGKKVNLREFLLNMLTEKEFDEYYKTPETKIEALYRTIVNRDSDEAGKKFWVDEYNKALKVYGSSALALQNISDRMVNENELKELATKLNVEW